MSYKRARSAQVFKDNFLPFFTIHPFAKMKAGLFLALPTVALAFPGFLGVENREEAFQKLHEMRDVESTQAASEPEKRQLLGAVTGLVSTVTGLLGSVASSVDPSNYRPEPGYTFQAPGSGDSRGPCPGLNLLANYGYLPRNGYVNFGQVVDATA